MWGITNMKYIIVVCAAISFLATLARGEDKWTPSPLCPYPSEDLTRTPYEGDCTKFWECFEGARYIMTCPVGLEFNDEAHSCDRPELAHCNKDETVTYPTYPHTQDPTEVTTPFSPDPMCPYPSEELVFYPYPLNCTQYWECFEGKKYLMDCPINLFWNVNYDYCDYLENVDCNKNYASTTSRPSTTTGTGTTSVPTNGTGTTPPNGPTDGWTPDPLCPYPSEQLVFFPYLLNCSQYWECYEGNKYLMSCPAGLYWNDKADNCDYLRNVDCTRATTPVPTTSTTALTTTTTTPAPTTITPATTTNTTVSNSTSTTSTTPLPTTPAIPSCANVADGVYFTDPTDCSRYYECSGGTGISMGCPGGLLWNEDTLNCDYPQNVKC